MEPWENHIRASGSVKNIYSLAHCEKTNVSESQELQSEWFVIGEILEFVNLHGNHLQFLNLYSRLNPFIRPRLTYGAESY